MIIRTGESVEYWAGAGPAPDDLERWPDLELRRRRHPTVAYRDRTPEDEPIEWLVTLWLGPKRDDPDAERTLWDGLPPERVDAIAEGAGARWDDEARVQLFGDIAKAERAARRRGHPGTLGWTSSGAEDYRLRIVVSAATEVLARAAAESRFVLPDDLVLEDVEAHPRHP